MKAEYKRDLKDNYLILSALEEKEEDDYSIYMVEKNKIPGLLPVHRSRMDGALLLNYEITGKQPLTSLYEQKQLGCADILSILSELGDVIEILQKYLLSPENLVFDPEYIFLEADRKKLCLCYAPGVKTEASIRSLAEFILRRLDHKNAEAVAAGYRFYEKTLEENFSLQSSLKELLLEYQNRENGQTGKALHRGMSKEGDTRYDVLAGYGENTRSDETTEYGDGMRRSDKSGYAAGENQREESGYKRNEPYRAGVESRKASGYAVSPKYRGASLYEEPEVIHKTRRKERNSSEDDFLREQAGDKGKNSCEKTNTDRKKAEKENAGRKKNVEERGNERFVDRIFQTVHPAVLISGLFLLATLEVLFYLGYLQLTETGGAFFLVLSVELLINSFWKRSKEEKQKQKFEQWEEEEEEDEEYQELIQEMYQKPEASAQPEEIGETRCLSDLKQEEELRLIAVRSPESQDPAGGGFTDIIVRRGSVTVGKMRQQCEVVLMAPAISRMHARLEYRQGAYYLKDLNSRNGTFLNGERLMPQEARIVDHGDRVAFADIQYRAVKM